MNLAKGRGGRQVSPAPLYLVLTLLAIATLLLAGETARADHPSGNESVSAVLDEKPQALEGVTVQIQNTQGTQLVVENGTQESLEVYDAQGEPFLRIGPEGVEANRSAEAFYETYGPRGINAPEDIRGEQPPDWQRISDRSSWGWFDRRLRTDDLEVPKEVLHSEETAGFGEWTVPVSLGGKEARLRGSYRYEPEPGGAYVPALTSEPERAGIEAQLSQGYGGPSALFLQNSGKEPVTVLDSAGKPALRIGPEEIQANMKSPVGRAASLGGSAGTTSDGTGEPEWRTVSGGSSFSWQDPRLRPPNGEEPPTSNTGERQEVSRWSIPLESSGERYVVEGVIEWQPLQDAEAGGESGQEHSGHDHASHDHSDHEHSGGAHSGSGSNDEGTGDENASPEGVYEAGLAELNGSGVSGSARVEFEGSNLVEVTVEAGELAPDETHELHIHGLQKGEASCPSGREVGHREIEEAVGQHVLDLEPYPTASAGGKLTFEGTFPQAAGSLQPLQDKALVVHGRDTRDGYDPQAAVACGEFRSAEGAVGADGGRMLLYGSVGLAALALPAVGLILIQRRWRTFR